MNEQMSASTDDYLNLEHKLQQGSRGALSVPSGLGCFPLWQQQHATPAGDHPACFAAKPHADLAAQSSATAAFGFGHGSETPRNLLTRAGFPGQLGQLAWQRPAAKHKCLVNIFVTQRQLLSQGLCVPRRQGTS